MTAKEECELKIQELMMQRRLRRDRAAVVLFKADPMLRRRLIAEANERHAPHRRQV
jgi:hypothetical protein